MAPSEPAARYRVVYSDAVKQRLRELSDVAIARGDGPALLAALKDFVARLPIYPQFGDPIMDLTGEKGQVRLGIIRPLSTRYGVFEESRMVFCGTLPILLPMDKPDASSSE
ncbi:MAG TPA: hypothetical protein VMG10_15050 [Gemmataceae bacterium]|nr:hypothetical protein [Gemmataceae bacterium]